MMYESFAQWHAATHGPDNVTRVIGDAALAEEIEQYAAHCIAHNRDDKPAGMGLALAEAILPAVTIRANQLPDGVPKSEFFQAFMGYMIGAHISALGQPATIEYLEYTVAYMREHPIG